MTVYKKDGGWRADVFIGGRRMATQQGFARRRDAELWHDEKRLELARAPIAPAAPRPRRRFGELLALIEERHLPTIRPGTAERYRVDVRYRIEPFFGDLHLDEVTPGLVEEFKSRCVASGLAPKSINNCLHTLRLILGRAVRWEMIEQSPYHVESLKIPEEPYEWYSEADDVQRFVAAARTSRYHALYLTALETGMRFGEILGLSKADVDFKTGQIHVHRQWLERQGEYGPVKHARPRMVPFDPSSELGLALRKEILRSGHAEAVFTTATGERPCRGGVAHKFLRAVQRRGRVAEISFHALRHTYASWYMKLGGSVWDLMALLGHSSIKTTMRYAHHAQNERRQPLNLAGVTPNSLRFERVDSLSGGTRYRKSGGTDGT